VKISRAKLTSDLSTVVDPTLAHQAVDSYVELQRRFLAGDWQPAELDAGRLCEAISRCLLQLDSGKVNHKLLPGKIREVLLDEKQLHTHVLDPKDRQHISKVVDMVYKFRSDRGAVHISTLYSANQMDSMLVLHAAKWIFAELLRLTLQQDRQAVGEMIAQLVQIEHSIIHELDGKPLVLAKGITVPEEILLLLMNADGNRLSRAELREYSMHKPNTVNVTISRLIKSLDIRPTDDKEVSLTPNGEKRILEQIMPKLAKSA